MRSLHSERTRQAKQGGYANVVKEKRAQERQRVEQDAITAEGSMNFLSLDTKPAVALQYERLPLAKVGAFSLAV